MDNQITYDIKEKNIINIDNLPDLDESSLEEEPFFMDLQNQFNFFDHDNIIAQEIDYNENYTKAMLVHIASYYKVYDRKLKKDALIQKIVEFENDPANIETVYNRKKCWHFINELKNDKYFSKFIIFNN
jgi:hypothetical protein